MVKLFGKRPWMRHAGSMLERREREDGQAGGVTDG